QATAVTGRLSSSDPNLQNIPIRTEIGAQIRRAFVPGELSAFSGQQSAIGWHGQAYSLGRGNSEWTLLTADYSQIELRVLAHFSGDENLKRAFEEDLDIHAFVASQVFNVPLEQVTKEERGRAKTVNFGIVYGQSAFGLARQTGMSQSEARNFIDA